MVVNREWDKFEKLDEDVVRRELDAYHPEKAQSARDWLDSKGAQRNESSRREQIKVARSAKNAAWAAAIAAAIAAICAAISFAL